MKPATKSYAVLFLLVLIVVSCGPVTPVPLSVAATTALTPTSKPVSPTSTQDVATTPTPTSIPQLHANDYELQPWNADDGYYSRLIDEFSKDIYVGFNNRFQRFGPVFQAEKLLWDPSSDWRSSSWKIVTDYPKGIPLPGMRPGEDLLAFLMEDLLNNENVKPEELPLIVKSRIQKPWECYRAEIVESPSKRGNYLVVNNLFSDQQDSWLFYTGSCEGTAIYAVRTINDQYRIEKVRDWQALEVTAAGYNLVMDAVSDVNTNGIPEVILNVSYGASGTPPYSGRNLEFYEWDPSKEIFLSNSTEMFEEVCYSFESCEEEWRIEKGNVQGVHPVVVKELYVTMYDDFGELSVCDPLVIEHTYLWKDGKFTEQKQTLLPPTDERIDCQLSWALQVLNRRNREIPLASDLISKALGNWPNRMNDMWGPASKDYFSLRLGLFYDLTGREDEGVTLLHTVAEHPTNPEFDFASELASAYLDVRSKQGKVQACQEINLRQTEAEQIDGPYVYVPINMLRANWGFGAPIWSYRIDDICDVEYALELSVRQVPNLQFKNIEGWLTRIGLNPLKIQTIYKSNTLMAWLVTLPAQDVQFSNEGNTMERVDTQQMWLFTGSHNGLNAIYVDDIKQNTTLSSDYLTIGQSGILVTIETILADFQRFFIFHVRPNSEIQTLLLDYYVDGAIDHKTNEIMTIAGSYGAEQPDIDVYSWNTGLGKLDKRTINFDFSKAQGEAERLVFRERDFVQAILYINMFFTQAPPEPKEVLYCQSRDCTYYPDWYRPYMRYLLALAYEMSGRTEQARDIYFALWQDYPSNIFGLTAEHRLIPAKP